MNPSIYGLSGITILAFSVFLMNKARFT